MSISSFRSYSNGSVISVAAAGGGEEMEQKPFSFYFTPTCYAQVVRKEIEWLEIEITRLEQHLLSLYKNTYQQQHQRHMLVSTHDDYNDDYNHDDDGFSCSESTINYNNNTKIESPFQVIPSHGLADFDIPSKDAAPHPTPQKASPLKFEVNRQSPLTPSLVKEHEKENAVGHRHVGRSHSRSLADHLGFSSFSSPINTTTTATASTPDRLSQDIVKCISRIYYKLVNLGSNNHIGVKSSNSYASSSSLSSSLTTFYSETFYDDNEKWSPLAKRRQPYYGAVQVSDISCVATDDTFHYVAKMLEKYRSLVKSLEKVNPTKMKREEKLVFWINIHNALVMHAHFAYGTQDRLKSSSFLKAAYNVGGYSINAYTIQTSILGVCSHYSLPWLQSLLYPGNKFKMENMKHEYAIGYSEPLVHFALCSGAYSDPAVRVYRAKNVFDDLKLAKEEFARASIHVHKESKLLVPKIFNYFAKDMSLDERGLLKVVCDCGVTISVATSDPQILHINWLPQSSAFRYIIHRQLAQEIVSCL